MGFMNWLLNGVGFETEEVYDDSVEREKKHDEKIERQRQIAREKAEYKARKAQEKADRAARKYALKQTKDVVQQEEPRQTTVSYTENPEQYNITSYSSSSLDNFGSNSSNVGGYGTKNVEFVYPTSFDDVTKIISYLKEGESVMLNLNQMNEYDSQRLLDCTSGAVYALNGNIRHVDNNIYLITPEGFNIRMPEQANNNIQNQQ